MFPFEFQVPTKIYFGSGIFDSAVHRAAGCIKSGAMVVTGKSSMRKEGYTQRLVNILQSHGLDVTIFDEISSNPKIEEINHGICLGLSKRIHTVIGLGGGSAIDAAKAIAVGLGAKEEITPYVLEGKEPGLETLPLIAIPSTAGTGSEVSMGAIISSTNPPVKIGIRSRHLYPRIAIVDPDLTLCAPKTVVRESGFDVLCHGIESYLSLAGSPITDTLALEAIGLVIDNLPKRLSNSECDNEAVKNMSYASMLMGINLGNASTCLTHRMQYPIGACTDTSHAFGLACLFPAWIKHGHDTSRDKFCSIANLLSGSDRKQYTQEQVLELFDGFLSNISFNVRLSDIGIEKSDIGRFCEMVTGNLSNDPIGKNTDIVRKIYEDSL